MERNLRKTESRELGVGNRKWGIRTRDQETLIRRRHLHVVDHKDLDRSLGGLQFEAQLLLERGKEGRSGIGRGATARRRRGGVRLFLRGGGSVTALVVPDWSADDLDAALRDASTIVTTPDPDDPAV